MEWLRLYTEIIDDPKIARMQETTFKDFIMLMCYAQELDADGVIDESVADVAWRLRIPEDRLGRSISDMRKLNILSADGPLEFIHWSKRQYRSDDAAYRKRVQREREKDRSVLSAPRDEHFVPENTSQTHQDTNENMSRDMSQDTNENMSRDMSQQCPVVDTEQSRDRDRNRETARSASVVVAKEKNVSKNKHAFVLPDWIPRDTWNAYLEVRQRKKAAMTDYALNLIVSELEKIQTIHGQNPVEVINKSIKSGWTDVYPLKEKETGGVRNGASYAKRESGGAGGISKIDAEVAAIVSKWEKSHAASAGSTA